MEQTWMVGFVAILLSAVIVLFNRRSRRYKAPPPPGALGWPFVGETIQFLASAYSDRPQSFMDDRRHRYGKVFKSHLFGRPTVVSTDGEVSRGILQCDAETFVPCFPKSLTELLGRSSILLINGGVHRRLHGLIAAFFKSPQLKSRVTAILQDHIRESMAAWQDDQLVLVQSETKRIAFQVLVKALISLDPGEEMEYMRKHFKEFIAGFASLPVKFPGSQLYKSLQAKKKMVKTINKVIEAKRETTRAGLAKEAEDAADLFLDHGQQLSSELISDNLIDLMVPGEDSIPVLVALAIKYLSDCPLALQQFTEENMKLKSMKDRLGEPLLWNDYTSLPFTQCVITETLRMGSIISGVMREAKRDVMVKGYFIPKGWCVMTDFRSVHLDQNQYESPLQFNPWRWQEREMSSCMNSSSFTPFGGGQRLCPGADLARLEASIFLHHFVTQFSWAAEDDSAVTFPTLRMKNGMPVRVKHRSGI